MENEQIKYSTTRTGFTHAVVHTYMAICIFLCEVMLPLFLVQHYTFNTWQSFKTAY